MCLALRYARSLVQVQLFVLHVLYNLQTVYFCFVRYSLHDLLCFCSVSSSSPYIAESPTDTTPPVISNCPASFTVSPNPGETAAMVSWVEPTATDDSGTVIVDRTHTPPAIFGPGP